MNEYNVAIAAMLRTLADYLEMAEGEAKVKVGVKFKLKNRPVVSIPVMQVDKFSAHLGAWASQELINTVERYRRETGATDGDDLLSRFSQARDYMQSLTK